MVQLLPPKLAMPQLAILNYATCAVDIIDITPATFQKYADDLDVLVYDVMGYRRDEVYYMVGETGIRVNQMAEDEIL